MSLEVKIPAMGESIASGVLAKWLVQDGDTVAKDQPLFELETDKITTEGLAEAAGRISLKVEPGAEVKIGQVVALIADAAEAPVAGSAGSSARAAAAAASPAVRRLAEETGVNPAALTGSGKAGRVTKGDLIAAAGKTGGTAAAVAPSTGTAPASPAPGAPAAASAAPASATASASSPASPPSSALPSSGTATSASASSASSPTPASSSATPPTGAEGRQSRRKLSPLRQRLAERLVAAQHQAAMLTTFNEVDMSAVMALRSRYQDEFVKKNGLKLGFMSFFVKAVVHALKQVPAVNCRLDGDTLIQNHYYDVAVAVSTEKGLMVPVVRDCDSLGLAALEKAVADLAGRAREGRITMAELEGGVFTITNGGIFGSMLSTPILNPPQSAILGMHAINDRAVVVGGQVVVRPVMYLALSYDHRVVDGREAVTFLVKVKQAIEDPARLLLGV